MTCSQQATLFPQKIAAILPLYLSRKERSPQKEVYQQENRIIPVFYASPTTATTLLLFTMLALGNNAEGNHGFSGNVYFLLQSHQ